MINSLRFHYKNFKNAHVLLFDMCDFLNIKYYNDEYVFIMGIKTFIFFFITMNTFSLYKLKNAHLLFHVCEFINIQYYML